jgi:dGTPase
VSNLLYAETGQDRRPSGSDGVRGSEELGRTAFRKDYARLLHAPSFRRLQGKTQLFPGIESDFFRNRLTHSLEVAQIAQGLAARLNKRGIPEAFSGAHIDEGLVEFAAIAHDLGHPPFGHNGEHALDELMRNHGGFEGNAQTLRILSTVERKVVKPSGSDGDVEYGLDLTFRSLASVLKYDQEIAVKRPSSDSLQKGYYASESALVALIKDTVAPNLPKGAKFKTIECAIMDLADDIAYSTYDLEDSLHAGFVSPSMLAQSLINDIDVQKNVIKKVDKALMESGWHSLSGIAEVVDVVVDAFDIKMPPTAMNGAELPDRHRALLVNAEARTADQAFCSDGLARAKFTAERVGRLIGAIELVPNKDFPQLSGVRLRRPELLQVEVFKHLNYELVIRSPRLAVVEHRGKDVIHRIFNSLDESKGALLPTEWRARYDKARAVAKGHQARKSSGKRIICDYVACMTDRYAAEFYSRLFGEGSSIFKPL